MRALDSFVDYLYRKIIQYKDRSAPIRSERFRGQTYIPYADEPAADMIAERQDAIVAIGVRVICNALIQLPARVMKVHIEDGEYRYELDDKHPFNQIIDEPNKDNTWSEIITHIGQSLILNGRSYLNQELVAGELIELWPLEPNRVQIEIDSRTSRKTGFRYGIGTSTVSYRPDEIIHHRLYNINRLVYGGSLIEPIHPEILNRHFVNLYQKSVFKNGAHMDRAFMPKDKMTPENREAFSDALRAKYGGAENAGKTFVTPVDGTFHDLAQKNKDLGFEPLLKIAREVIFAMIGVPPFLGGVMEFANYANAVAQDKTFWRHTMLPLVKLIQDGFNKQTLWPHYDYDHVLQFDTSKVQALQEDAKEAAETDAIRISSGVQTVNEIRAKLGLEPLPEKPEPAVDEKEVEEPEPKDIDDDEDDKKEVQLDIRLIKAGQRLERTAARYGLALANRENQDNGNGNGHKEGDYEQVLLNDARFTVPRRHRNTMEAPAWTRLLQ